MPSTKERVRAGGCLVIVLIITFFGFAGLKTALFERAPTRLSFANYARQPVKAKWLELSDVRPDFASLVWTESLTGSINEVYIPLQPRSDRPLAKTPAVLWAKEGDLIALASWVRATKNQASGPEVERARTIIAELDQKMQSISGLVVTGLDKSKSTDSALANLRRETTYDPKIIEWNATPSFGFHLVLLIVCAFFALGLLVQLFGKQDEKVPELRESD
jgi:hypothetical protein